jgi:hypothetical protein
VVARAQIEFLERRQRRGQRSAGGLGVILHGWWRLYFVSREWLEFSWIFVAQSGRVRYGSPCAYSRRDVSALWQNFFMGEKNGEGLDASLWEQ